jgi:hypothetical protein
VPVIERREYRTVPAKGYGWLELLRPGQLHGESFVLYRQFDGSLDAGQALQQATVQSKDAAKLLRVRHLPSLRILPGQRLQDLLPEGARLESGTIYLDYFAWPFHPARACPARACPARVQGWPDEAGFAGAPPGRTIMPNSDSDLKCYRSVSHVIDLLGADRSKGQPKSAVSKLIKTARSGATVPPGAVNYRNLSQPSGIAITD